MNNLYLEMLKTHPIQDEWDPKPDDVFMLKKEYEYDFGWKNNVLVGEQYTVTPYETDAGYYGPDVESLTEHDDFREHCIYLPRQEDWQDIFSKKYDWRYGCLDDIQFFVIQLREDMGYDAFDDVFRPCSHKEIYTLVWCLFVSKEVYNIKWDWKESNWVKIE